MTMKFTVGELFLFPLQVQSCCALGTKEVGFALPRAQFALERLGSSATTLAFHACS